MVHLPAAKARKTQNFPSIRAAVGDGGLDRGGKFGGDKFIGIKAQHPRAGSKRKRIILLRAKTAPFVKRDAGALFFCQLHRRIGAAAIDHNALVAKREAVKTRPDIRCLVLGDDDGAELRHELLLSHAGRSRAA